MAEANLAHLHVERRGAGPLVVLTHGGGDSTATWEAQTAHLSEHGWRTVAWDLRGHGRSAAPRDAAHYSRETGMADLAALAGEQPPAVLAGHSLGGYLSLGVALAQPELVRALVLVATGPGFRDPAGRDTWNANAASASARLGVVPEATGLLAQHDSWVIDNLGAITAPTLLVVGDGDAMFLGASRYLAGKLGGATELVVVPDAGHHVHRRVPDVVNAAIDRFLASLPPVS